MNPGIQIVACGSVVRIEPAPALQRHNTKRGAAHRGHARSAPPGWLSMLPRLPAVSARIISGQPTAHPVGTGEDGVAQLLLVLAGRLGQLEAPHRRPAQRAQHGRQVQALLDGLRDSARTRKQLFSAPISIMRPGFSRRHQRAAATAAALGAASARDDARRKLVVIAFAWLQAVGLHLQQNEPRGDEGHI